MWQEKNDRKLFVHLHPIYPAPLHFTLYIIFHITAVFKYFSDEITILFKHPICCWCPSFSTSISTMYLLLITFSISLAILHHICYWWPSYFTSSSEFPLKYNFFPSMQFSRDFFDFICCFLFSCFFLLLFSDAHKLCSMINDLNP